MYRDRLSPEKKQSRFRLIIQLCAAALLNGYAAGFTGKKLYTGGLKKLCVPVLNCYSCPGALGACPIGAMQTVLGSQKHRFPFYALGTLVLFGTVFGRLLCGFICPFGLIQDLLHKIPLPKLKIPRKIDRPLRYLKYVILVVFVFILPVAVTDSSGLGDPWFCKYICPAGTLEGGIPNMLLDSRLRQLAGALFTWKMAVLAGVIIGSVFISRFFCRYLCPLGAFYSLFSRFSLYQMSVDSGKCVGCGKCEKACPMAVKITEEPCSGECIRCGKCKAACGQGAISSGFRLDTTKTADAKNKTA